MFIAPWIFRKKDAYLLVFLNRSVVTFSPLKTPTRARHVAERNVRPLFECSVSHGKKSHLSLFCSFPGRLEFSVANSSLTERLFVFQFEINLYVLGLKSMAKLMLDQ